MHILARYLRHLLKYLKHFAQNNLNPQKMRIIFEDKDFGRNASVKCPDNIHTEMYIAMDKRIRELEAQVQELIEELIEELQDVVCFAPECTTSKEYAVKRLEELMNNKWEAK